MQVLRLFLICTSSCFLISCNNSSSKKENSSGDSLIIQDSAAGNKGEAAADTTLESVKTIISSELGGWTKSFTNFQLDSFHKIQATDFEQIDYSAENNEPDFFKLYKASLSYSPDSSQFIDLYSAGISLEKKGKKIIAIGDVDMAVTLCNLKNKQWKRIASFGPSAGVEEAVWASGTKFILAGTMQGDNGEVMPFILVGDTDTQKFQWFESKCVRPETTEYKASGLTKLKIDEWE